jgi:4-amino-4-deoxy-L-arabinose transferase-like glycosyltransferase
LRALPKLSAMSTPSVSLPALLGARVRSRSLPRPRPELLALLALAAVLDLWSLSRNGYANEYYGAAVRSMSTSWHAFLYGSFDASGVMTVDKPPLALWVQALSARVFGFGSWSLLVPQALMGVATVALAYDLTRRRFGRPAGFAAGLVLALTPITVAISRHNNPDALLVLCCVAAVWTLVRGLEDGRTRWLVASGVCVGLGFEAKMGAALLVVPALAAAWLWVAPRGRWTAVRQLAAGGAAMAAVGLAWPVLVWLTPAADRPWISGTADNSVWSLILGYNGFGRLLGQDGGPAGGGIGGGAGGGGPFGGQPGPLRLLNQALGGQAGWLLGAAVVGGLGLVAITRLRRADPRSGWLLAVGGSFLVIAVAFSKAQGIFHPYYVSQLAPFGALLVGATMGEVLRGGRAARVVGALAVAGGVATELAVLHDNPGQLAWLAPVLVVGGGAAALALLVGVPARARAVAVAAALGVLLVAPAAWSAQTLGHATSGTFPAGGPADAGGGFGGGGGGRARFGGAGGPGFGGRRPQGAPPGAGLAPGGGAPGAGAGNPFGGSDASLTEALAYVRQHGGGTVAVSSQSGAASQLLASGSDVVAIGGFSGRESQVSLSWLADAVASGRIRWVLADGAGGLRQDNRIGSSQAMAAVQATCKRVSAVSSGALYDCQGRADALRAAAS